jgi:hypothetical protein
MFVSGGSLARVRRFVSGPGVIVFAAVVALGLSTGVARAQASFVAFETGQVRPLALSPDGTRLFAANTPDNRLEIFQIDGVGITHLGAVPVGL